MQPGSADNTTSEAERITVQPDALENESFAQIDGSAIATSPEIDSTLLDGFDATLDTVQRFLAPIANTTENNRHIFEWFTDNRDSLVIELAVRAASEDGAGEFDLAKFSSEVVAGELLREYLLTQHFANLLHARRAGESELAPASDNQTPDHSPFASTSYDKMTREERKEALPEIIKAECTKLGMLDFLLEQQGYAEFFPADPNWNISVQSDGANKWLLHDQFGINYDEVVGNSELLRGLKATLAKGVPSTRAKEACIRLARQELGITEEVELADINELKQLRLQWSRRLEDEVVYTTIKKTDAELYAELNEKATLLGMEILDLSGRGDTQALLEEELLQAFQSQSYTTLVKALQGLSTVPPTEQTSSSQQYAYLTEIIFRQLFDLSKPDRHLDYTPNVMYMDNKQQLLYAAEDVSLLECLKSILKQRKNVAQAALSQTITWQESVRPASEQLSEVG